MLCLQVTCWLKLLGFEMIVVTIFFFICGIEDGKLQPLGLNFKFHPLLIDVFMFVG